MPREHGEGVHIGGRLGEPFAGFARRVNKPLFVALRLIAFPLTWLQYASERAALAEAVSLKAMGEKTITVRKGDIGDWKNHLDDEHWGVVDQTIQETLEGLALYAPLAEYARR